ncbi:MAG: MoxR family ATPase, partial [Chloroflexota bacterium]|nr:MoxR family ATPase [Chloroflexota bacterium]
GRGLRGMGGSSSLYLGASQIGTHCSLLDPTISLPQTAKSRLSLGASPRASVALLLASRAVAAVDGRPYVQPDDVKAIAPSVLAHRVIVRPEAQLEGITGEEAVKSFLASVEVPR